MFYKQCCSQEAEELPGWIKLSDSGNEDFIKQIFNNELKGDQIHQGYYFDVAKKLTEAIATGMKIKSLGVNDPKTKLFEKFKNNVYAFSAAKSLTVMQEYSRALKDENGEERSYGQFRTAVIPVDQEFNDAHLKTEYRGATSKAQMGDKWDKLQKYNMITYRTVGDGRVRLEHEKLDGLTLPPSHPLWAKIYPPNDWGCRCTVIPAQGAAQTNTEAAQQYANSPALKPYFKGNSGIEHVAFNEDHHPYFERVKQFKTGLMKQVELLAEENYAMQPVEKIMSKKGLTPFTPEESKEAALAKWNSINKQVKSVDGVKWDFKDRWEHVVESHQDQDRWKYINNLKDVVGSADEVWMTKEKMPDGSVGTFKRYVKYYQDKPVVFSYPVDQPDNWTMYAADMDSSGSYKKMRDVVRRGVLVHRK